MLHTVCYFNQPVFDSHLDINELALLMGYGRHSVPDDVSSCIREIFLQIQNLCLPKCGYVIFPGKFLDTERVRINDTEIRPGKIITAALKNARYFAVFTVTLGKEFDRWSSVNRQKGDILFDYITDALGSVLAEGIVNDLHEKLSAEMLKSGLRVSNNYSPGYCDWKLNEQEKLFSLLPAGISDIELTDSCLMLPLKSVSGIVGIGENLEKQPYKCDICRNPHCIKNKG